MNYVPTDLLNQLKASAGAAGGTTNTDRVEEACWDVIFAYFNQGGGADASQALVQHQIESYNEFIDKKLYQIIHGFNPIQINHQYRPESKDFVYKIYIKIHNPCLSKPTFQTQDGTQLPMTPHIARMNNLTYASQLTVDIAITTETINEDNVVERKESVVSKVNIGKIPIMVRSKICLLNQLPGLGEGDGRYECRYDPGGYFIINGNEKVVVSQDRISENKTLVFAPNVSSNDGLTAEIRSMPDGVFLPPKICSIHLSNKPNPMGRVIKLNTTFLKSEIPLFVMFRALGIVSDREILQHIVLDLDDPKNQRLLNELKACAEDASDITTQADAIAVLQRMMSMSGFPREYMDQPAAVLKYFHQTLRNDFLSHTGTSYRRKALYLGYMVRKLLRCHLGYTPYDNRDSYIYKRIDTPGILLSILFRQCYGKLIKESRNLIQRELHLWRAATKLDLNQIIHSSNIHRFLKPNIIESCFRYALSTGNWIVKTLGSYQNNRQGVAQVLNRMAYLSMLSHLRRINTPMEKNGKLVQPRKLENTQYGMICPAETPEGGSVGLVKNMALSTRITTYTSSAYIREQLPEMGVQVYGDDVSDPAAYLTELANPRSVLVQVNGDLVGYHTDPATFYARMKRMKRLGEISPFTAVYWNVPENTIVLNTEAGRMCRPMLIVDDDGELRLAKILKDKTPAEWRAFIEQPFHRFVTATEHDRDVEGFVEFMDVEEIDKGMMAMFPKDLTQMPRKCTYTHCEIHPSLMNGVLAVNIPFSDHNQSPRNAYQCLWEEEPVLMADGTRKKIKDVRPGDKVITFDPKTMRTFPTKVIHQYTRETDKNIVKVRTGSGREIITTDDHKYWTNEGWKCPTEFTKTTKCAFLACLHNKHLINKNERQWLWTLNADTDYYAQGDTVFMPVTVEPMPNCRIADITVESDTHCFFGGDGFAVHNSAMGKQAVGIYMSNFNQRIDTIGHLLNYAQKPLARTKLSKITHSENLPSGVNAVVAIMTYTGFNQEDSVMINKSALDRGLFSSTYYKSYKDQCNKNHSTGEEEIFTHPDAKTTAHMKPFNYGKVGADGFVPKNTYVDSNDIIVGKVMPHKIQGTVYPKDASLYMKANDTGHIDMNYQGVNGDGYKFCKVRLRKYRKPTIGDKVSSRHGQKGTIGMIYNQQDMPFSRDGIVPDIIINPHAIPSRMTIGQMIECVMGKAACSLGALGDATPFNGCSIEDIANVLEEYGMERYGNEILYDGRTGCQIHTEIFMGPTFYQRLKHMVEDKMHTRGGNGPVVMLTRQPAEGRARNGGLRFGEMERDAIVGHGASAFLKERMLDVSDNYRVFVCRKCGIPSVANPERNIYKCTYCKNSADITQVRIPYSMKLLLQELMSMAIAPRLIV
jgi:DNA-directed RNA polymerase beta subunit